MRLCYEKLDQMTLSRNGFFRRKGCSYIYKDACKNCGEPYLTSNQHQSLFCGAKCKHKYKPSEEELKDWEEVEEAKVIKNKRYFELIDKGQIHPLYERYEILAPYYEIRRAVLDRDYLEIKCAYCHEWFTPSINTATKVKCFVQGHNSKKIISTFYCCTEHQTLLYRELRRLTNLWYKKNIPIEQFIIEEREAIREKELYLSKIIKKKEKKERQALLVLKRKKLKEIRELEKERKRLERIANYKTPNDYSRDQKERLEKLRTENPKEFKLRRLFVYSKVRAKEKNMDHSITRKWLNEKTESNLCEVTELPFDYDTTLQRNPFGPSIDRIDVSKGYTPENCRLVIWVFNAGLGHYTEKELYIICKAYLLNNS